MKTIAFITPKIDTFSNPTLISIIEKLLDQNYKILFFGFEQLFVPPEMINRLEYRELPFNFYKFNKNTISIFKLLRQYYELYKILRLQNKVNAIICIDPMGLVIAGRVQKIVKATMIYASFEIFFEDEFFVQRKKILKELEMKYSEKVSMVIVQDPRREKLLRAVSNFRNDTLFLHIPVSPKPMQFNNNKFDIRKELNIPEGKTIVVYSGTLQNWCGINEMLNLFPDQWDPDYWLVIHSHHTIKEGEELKNKLNYLIETNQPVSFHNDPFYRFEDYANFLSACDIGIATYFPNTVDIFAGKNIQVIGLSSGKFSTYMMLGIPTVTTSDITYEELNRKYNFGEIINTIADLPKALNKIRKDSGKKSKGCKVLYESVLNPVLRINNLVKRIDKLYN